MKLIVHIGAGKTGSSSVQATLEKHKPLLAENSIRYLGIMLENCSNDDKPNWQFRGGSDLFFLSLPEKTASKQLKRVLAQEIQTAQDVGIETLIWSNEWLFSKEHSKRVVDVISEISASGVDVEIICYIRRHDKWLQSAYLQWGLKHKTYTGDIQDFHTWRQGRSFKFFPDISVWETAFGKSLEIFNYDEIEDVSKHFFEILGLSNIDTSMDNISPPPEHLAAWTVYNNRFARQVPASEFKQLLRYMTNGKHPKVSLPTISDLTPSVTDLEKVVQENSADIEKINFLLADRGQDSISFSSPVKGTPNPDEWRTNQFVLSLLFGVTEQLIKTQKRLQILENKDKSSES